jgi:hypothetical protein
MIMNINSPLRKEKVGDYRTLFDKAQDNFALVCKEFKNTAICQRHRRTRRTSTQKITLI